MRTSFRYIDLREVIALTWIWASISHSGRVREWHSSPTIRWWENGQTQQK